MGMTTAEMSLPIAKLKKAKHLTTKGQKRATTYHSRG